MNRLGPLIVRRVGPFAASEGYADPAAPPLVSSDLIENVKLFALVWLGGFVFFGTFIA